MKRTSFGLWLGVVAAVAGHCGLAGAAQTCFSSANLNGVPLRYFNLQIAPTAFKKPGIYSFSGIEFAPDAGLGTCTGATVFPAAGTAYVTATKVTLGFRAYLVDSNCGSADFLALLAAGSLSGPISIRNDAAGSESSSTLTETKCSAQQPP